jgi:hypothetical protein
MLSNAVWFMMWNWKEYRRRCWREVFEIMRDDDNEANVR